MPDMSAWLGAETRGHDWRTQDAPRPASVANLIAEKSSSIVVVRNGVAAAAQTVRIDVFGGSASERMGMGGNALTNTQRVLVLGYRNHPTIADTDLQANDHFRHDGRSYRVVKTEGGLSDRVEALAEESE